MDVIRRLAPATVHPFGPRRQVCPVRSTEVYGILRDAWDPMLREAGLTRATGPFRWVQEHDGHYLLISPQVSHHG